MSNEPKEHSSGFMAQDRTKVDLIYRQAAIDVMLAALDDDWEPDYAKDRMCELPSAQPDVTDTNVGDTIYREEAIKKIAEHLGMPAEHWMKIAEEWIKDVPSAQPDRRYDEWCTDCKEYDQEKHCCPRFNHVIRTTLQDAQRTGRWIEDSGNIACSECHIIWLHRRTAFCPNCGADMRGEQDE